MLNPMGTRWLAVWTLAVVGLYPTGWGWAQSGSLPSPPRVRHLTTAPAASPPSKNIFFPSTKAPLPAGGRFSTQQNEFIVAGTIEAGPRRAALIEFPASGITQWVNEGDRIGQMIVAEISVGNVVMELAGQQADLGVGYSSAALPPSRRIFGSGFALVGVCQSDAQQFALVQRRSDESIHKVRMDDRIGEASVVKITTDSIVLRLARAEQTVTLGSQFTTEAVVQ